MKRTMCYRILSVIMLICIIGSLFSSAIFANEADNTENVQTKTDVWGGSVANDYSGGYGTKARPYIIETPEQLALLAKTCAEDTAATVGRYYSITKDIYLNDISDFDWKNNNPNMWSFGTKGAFRGNLDGGGHVIRGLYINENTETDNGLKVGLFSELTGGATISYLGIEYSHIEACSGKKKNFAGAFAGYVGNAPGDNVLTGCYVDESVYVKGDFAGGFFGGTQEKISLVIDTSFSTCTVKSTQSGGAGIGAFIGDAWGERGNRVIKNSYAGTNWGTFAGNNTASFAYENCYGYHAGEETTGIKDVHAKILMQGELARKNMPEFDYDNVWEIVKSQTPRIRKPMTDADSIENQIKDKPYYRAAKLLSVLNIMGGRSLREYGEDDVITRAEMSAIIVKFAGMKDSALGGAAVNYADVDESHWAYQYIAAATALKIVGGEDGYFYPDKEVTAIEAIKMIISALGHDSEAELKGGYPYGYTRVALALGILRNIEFPNGYDVPVLRKQVAMLVYSALDAEALDPVGYPISNMTALNKYHHVYENTGTVLSTKEAAIEGQDNKANRVTINDTQYMSNLDFFEYLGWQVDYYYQESKEEGEDRIIAFFPNKNEIEEIEIDFDNISSINSSGNQIKIEYYNENDKKKEKIINNPIIMYNDCRENFENTDGIKTFIESHMDEGSMTLQLNSSSDKRNVIFIRNYKAYVVSGVNVHEKKIFYKTYATKPTTESGVLDFSGKGSGREVILKDESGAEIGFADLKEDNVVMVYSSTDGLKNTVVQSTKRVKGKIEGRKKVKEGAVVEERPDPVWTPVSGIDFNNLTSSTTKKEWEFNLKGNTLVQEMPYALKINVGLCLTKSSDVLNWANLSESAYGGIKGKYEELKREMNEEESNNIFNNKIAHIQIVDWALNEGKGSATLGADWKHNSIVAENIYDKEQVKVGETYRVSMWVYGNGAINRDTREADPSGKVAYNMWLMNDPNGMISTGTAYNTGSANGTNPDAPANGECLKDDEKYVPENEWHKLSITYKITNENKKASSLRLDNMFSSAAYPIAKNTFIAGYKVEKLTMPDGSEYIETESDGPIDTAVYDVTVNGVEYKSVDTFLSSMLKLGQTYELLLDENNKIVGYTMSESSSSFGLLLDVVSDSGNIFGDGIQVKILKTDGTIKSYSTLKEITAYNGSDIGKVNAKSLITDQPIDVKTSHYLWSTNNAKNCKGYMRTWMDSDIKSKQANRRIVHYTTNSDGVITSIIVPSAPVGLEKSKLSLKHNYAPVVSYNSTLKLVTVYNANGRTDFSYPVSSNPIVFEANAMNYDDEDYTVVKNGINGLTRNRWEYAQLYSAPGSDTVDFMVINTHSPQISSMKTVVVKGIGEGVDGYTLDGYVQGKEYTRNIKPGTRLMENIWTSSDEASEGEILTLDNIKDNTGIVPWCVAYESDFMGNQDTPEIYPGVLEEGDVVRVAENENGEIRYIEVVMRKRTGLVATYTHYSVNQSNMMMSNYDDIRMGIVEAIGIPNGLIKFKTYVWGGTEHCVSASLAMQDWSKRPVSEANLFFNPSRAWTTSVYDCEKGMAYQGSQTDYNVGDMILAVGSLQDTREVIIFKNFR